jgi:NAD-dependent dihydropyrimidine dehydrogenase PreA subunit
MQAGSLLVFLGLFLGVCWPYPEPFAADQLARRAAQPVEVFLWLDPLAGVAAGLAARTWQPALTGAALILAVCWLVPRLFCSHLCPLGTLIDLSDAVLGRWRHWRGNPPTSPGLRRLRFLVLLGVLGAAAAGWMLAGWVAAIPVVTRGLVFSLGNLQLGLLKNWGMVPELGLSAWVSLGLFAGVFLLSLITPRFWCKFACPTGALLSLPAWRGQGHRLVNPDHCVGCDKCLAACPFDAIEPDYASHPLNCTFCQTCAGVCPTHAIRFGLGPPDRPQDTRPGKTPLTRRQALGSLAAGAAVGVGSRWLAREAHAAPPIRPPGSVPEEQFLDLCIRCEQCLKVCPGPVLQAAGMQHGWESLWTPVAVFTHAGCHQDCGFCTEVCPTGAIRPLELAAKRRFKMGLAELDPTLCLPLTGKAECRICMDECTAAGYHAIRLEPRQLAPAGNIPEGLFSPEEEAAVTSLRMPVIDPLACVGCGLCENRCHTVLARQKGLLPRAAVTIKPATEQPGHRS